MIILSNVNFLTSNRHLDTENYRPALALIDTLLKELRRLDDKMILTEVHLLESRVYRGLNNFPKAKVFLYTCSSRASEYEALDGINFGLFA